MSASSPGMDTDTQNIFSFFIRVWKEETEAGEPEVWRGHITFLPDNERRYFAEINEIPALIFSHLNHPR